MNNFDWTLDRKDYEGSIFLKKKMREYADIRKVLGFIANKMGISYRARRGKHFVHLCDKYEGELMQIKAYKNRYSREENCFHVSYEMPKHKWGRVVPCEYLSQCIFHRPTRHAIARDSYVDLDIKACQPTIVYEVCKSNGYMMTDALKAYIDDSKAMREKVMATNSCSKDEAKRLFISILNGGTFEGWVREHNVQECRKIKEVADLEKCMKPIIDMVYAKNPAIKHDVLSSNPGKWKDDAEAKRGVMGLFYQSVEKRIQEIAVHFLVREKGFCLEDIVPCQDGCMIRKELYYADIEAEMNAEVFRATSLSVEWVDKAFDEAIDIPLYESAKSLTEWHETLNWKKLANRFISEFSNYVVRRGSCIYVFWGKRDEVTNEILDGRWYNETQSNEQYKIWKLVSEDLYEAVLADLNAAEELKEKELIDLREDLRVRTSRTSDMHNIIRHVLPDIPFADHDFDSNPYLLGFENGVYELYTDVFRPYRYDDYITMSTKYRHCKYLIGERTPERAPVEDPSEPLAHACSDDGQRCCATETTTLIPDAELELEMHGFDAAELAQIRANRRRMAELESIFESIHPDVEKREYFFQILASGLDGNAYQMLILFNGQGGNGKGLTGSLMDKALGGYYYQPSNGILKDAEKANIATPDMFNMKHKRYVNFKEVGGLIRVSTLRNLTGGGKFTGRLLHQNPEEFYLNATTVMEFNNAPELDGKPLASDYRRLHDLEFEVNFTCDAAKIGKVINGIQYREANPNYERQAFADDMRDTFLHFLLARYRQYRRDDGKGIAFEIPECVTQRTNLFIENQNLFQKVYVNNFQPCADTEAEVKLAVMWLIFKESDDYRAKSAREKREYGKKEFIKWAEETLVLRTGVGECRVAVGIRLIQCDTVAVEDQVNDDDDDDDLLYDITHDENDMVSSKSIRNNALIATWLQSGVRKLKCRKQGELFNKWVFCGVRLRTAATPSDL